MKKYIDAEEAKKRARYWQWETDELICRDIDAMPVDDVVPRAEYDTVKAHEAELMAQIEKMLRPTADQIKGTIGDAIISITDDITQSRNEGENSKRALAIQSLCDCMNSIQTKDDETPADCKKEISKTLDALMNAWRRNKND